MDAREDTGQHGRDGAERRPDPPASGVPAAADEKEHDRRYEQQNGQHEHGKSPLRNRYLVPGSSIGAASGAIRREW
jgi:hypothetical protein